MTDHDLDLMLHAVADRVVPPPLDVAADVVRGRRSRRRRRAEAGLAVVATLAVVAGASAWLLPGGEDADGSTPAAAPVTPTATDTNTLPPSPAEPTDSPTGEPAPPEDTRDAKQLLTDYRDTLADHLDPSGTHLDRKVTNVQSGGGIGTKLGWSVPGESGLGEVEVFVAQGFRNQFNWFCGDASSQCRHVTVGSGDDAIDAIVQDDNGQSSVGVRRDDGSTVVLTIDDLFGNNSTVPVSGLDLSVADLARTAVDPRFTVPTEKQIACVDHAFGWPSGYEPPGVKKYRC